MPNIGGPVIWGIFAATIVTTLVVDLGVFHRKPHVIRFREAAAWSGVWMSLAMCFNVLVYFKFGSDRALEFFQAWVIEKALSVDNIFVFLAIFSYFSVAPRMQHRVLFWGIVGALVTRGVFIWTGVALLRSFHWVMYVFGGFLILTALRMLVGHEAAISPGQNPVIRWFKRLVPVTSEETGTRFFVRRGHRIYATSLFMVLVVIEATDVVFAIDSIPAVLAITRDVFIVYTSNIFAILGLRALSFLVSDLVRRLRYLKVGLSLVLAFIGTKMIIGPHLAISELLSLGVVVTLLVGSALASLLAGPAIPAPVGDDGDGGGGDHPPGAGDTPTGGT